MNEIIDHIGIFNNVLSKDICSKYIEYYENLSNNNLVKKRTEYNHNPKLAHEVSDTSIDILASCFYSNLSVPYIVKDFVPKFWDMYNIYADKYSFLHKLNRHNIIDIKIQKTNVGEGFHEWHCEKASLNDRNRLLAFMVYLNDVEEGGETEFLYQHKRIKPEAGKLLMWPSQFTHTHRGNPPLSNVKYILTGWVEYVS
tara:strand:- start:1670 stop:2263 length:594 start_codon:yes stop_codon:yes gene_type:complete